MHRTILFVALALAVFAAHAASTLRVGSQVLSTGESATRAIQLLGEPSFKEPIESERGGYVGERWQFQRQDGRITTITVVGGKVGSIEDHER